MSDAGVNGASCAVPFSHKDDQIVMGHGAGGKMTADLVKDIFFKTFNNPILNAGNDGAVINFQNQNIVISTDCHVVTPLFFPGGDIGELSICGTVNDIAMMGAMPLYISVGFIIEEGFSIETLKIITESMQDASKEAGVTIVCGDTKVVPCGKADGIYITTTGFGLREIKTKIDGSQALPGDVIIVSGTIGDHGIAVVIAREDLGIQTSVTSDSAPLNHIVDAMMRASSKIHVLRDPTRGGLATSLNEIANQSNVCLEIDESLIPVDPAVSSICEMLGFDPLYIANEGKLIAIVAKEDAEKILEVMKNTKYGENSKIIGRVTDQPEKKVLLRTAIGSSRIVQVLMGEILPRIC